MGHPPGGVGLAPSTLITELLRAEAHSVVGVSELSKAPRERGVLQAAVLRSFPDGKLQEQADFQMWSTVPRLISPVYLHNYLAHTYPGSSSLSVTS